MMTVLFSNSLLSALPTAIVAPTQIAVKHTKTTTVHTSVAMRICAPDLSSTSSMASEYRSSSERRWSSSLLVVGLLIVFFPAGAEGAAGRPSSTSSPTLLARRLLSHSAIIKC